MLFCFENFEANLNYIENNGGAIVMSSKNVKRKLFDDSTDSTEHKVRIAEWKAQQQKENEKYKNYSDFIDKMNNRRKEKQPIVQGNKEWWTIQNMLDDDFNFLYENFDNVCCAIRIAYMRGNKYDCFACCSQKHKVVVKTIFCSDHGWNYYKAKELFSEKQNYCSNCYGSLLTFSEETYIK